MSACVYLSVCVCIHVCMHTCVRVCVCAYVYGCSTSAIGDMWLNLSLYKNERNDKKQKDFNRNAAYAQYVRVLNFTSN